MIMMIMRLLLVWRSHAHTGGFPGDDSEVMDDGKAESDDDR